MRSNLKGFSIDGATLTDICFQRILLCDKLEHFGFHRAYNLNGKTFSIIWQYLKNLRTLKLTFGNQVGNQDTYALFINGKKEMSFLEIIDFTGCWKMKNETIEAISDSCPNLKKLILKCCKNVTDIACLKKCENLEILNIAFCLRLSVNSWLPVQPSIQTIFIEQGKNLDAILKDLKNEKKHVNIRICHSQYTKSFEKYLV
ncbi:hypothetical protein HHI36_004213 [Cryptolaemus montrouzieri]|uniref:Uncharacterized protein n=1 Tax=Cryptolaemus montrouzieri TaxID=559131 RepID=A0ABD2NR08_9CUCU